MIKNVITTHNYFHYDVECDICGAGPLDRSIEAVSSVPDPKRGGEYWQTHYHVCFTCLKAGTTSFPRRIRKRAQRLEELARDLRKLAADAKWQYFGPTYAELMRKRRQEHAQTLKEQIRELRKESQNALRSEKSALKQYRKITQSIKR